MTTRKSSTKSSSSAQKAPIKNQLPREAAHPPAVAAVAAAAPQPVDEATGAAALKRVTPLLLAIPAAEVVLPPLNLRDAALAALGIYGLIESYGLVPRLEALAKIGELDIAQLERLPDLARATFYVRVQLEQATATASEAMIPAALAARAQDQRRRMLKLLDFHFDDDAKVFPTLDFIRRGSGYDDLAADLLGLVELYREHGATLKQTPNHYRPSDVKDAANSAAEILAWLGGNAAGGTDSAELVSPSALASRAGQLLVRAYDEVAEGARFLCRKDPALAARFPSLYSLTRARPAAASGSEPAPPDSAPSEPGTAATQPTT